MTDIHKIQVTLSETDVVMDPGSVAQLIVTLTNQQEAADRLSLEIEGIDVEWYAIPVPAVNVAPGAQATLKVPFRVARTSDNRAGTYPFLVRVQAMETGEVGVAQGTLILKPFSSLQMELSPKRAVASFFHPLNDFDVTIANQGNAEETLELFATDPDDGCAYEYDTDRITLKPGQTRVVPLAIRPKVSAILGGARLYGFTASARSMADSYISANVHGQIEKHALISPLMGIFVLLLGLSAGGYFIFRPQPPVPIRINAFNAENTKLFEGQQTTLTWDVSGVSKDRQQMVIFRQKGQEGTPIADKQLTDNVGHILVTPEAPSTIYKLVVRGVGGQKDASKSVEVSVTPAPPPLKPVIVKFSVTPTYIHPGDPIKFEWEGKNCKSFIFYPGNIQLGPNDLTYRPPDSPDQTTEYRLRGLNEKGQTADRTVTVRVVPPNLSIASIEYFTIKPSPVYVGDKVRLKWKTSYARTVHIDSSDPAVTIGDVSPGEGSQEIIFNSTNPVTFTLTATDSAKLPTTKTYRVTPKDKPLPVTPPDSNKSSPGNGDGITPASGATPPP